MAVSLNGILPIVARTFSLKPLLTVASFSSGVPVKLDAYFVIVAGLADTRSGAWRAGGGGVGSDSVGQPSGDVITDLGIGYGVSYRVGFPIHTAYN